MRIGVDIIGYWSWYYKTHKQGIKNVLKITSISLIIWLFVLHYLWLTLPSLTRAVCIEYSIPFYVIYHPILLSLLYILISLFSSLGLIFFWIIKDSYNEYKKSVIGDKK